MDIIMGGQMFIVIRRCVPYLMGSLSRWHTKSVRKMVSIAPIYLLLMSFIAASASFDAEHQRDKISDGKHQWQIRKYTSDN